MKDEKPGKVIYTKPDERMFVLYGFNLHKAEMIFLNIDTLESAAAVVIILTLEAFIEYL